MPEELDTLLERRRRTGDRERRSRAGVVASGLLHVALVAALVLAPRLAAEKAPVIATDRILLVPPPALGTPEPAPAPEKKPEKAPPAPEPEKEEAPPLTVPEPSREAAKEPPTPAEARPTPRRLAPSPPEGAASGLTGRRGSPQGSPGSTLEASTAVAGFDNPSFTYDYYVNRMVAMIRAHWSRPNLGSGVESVIHFRILRDGAVDELRIVSSSGYNSFDLAAYRAIQAASPLPPLPSSYREQSVGVTVIFQ